MPPAIGPPLSVEGRLNHDCFCIDVEPAQVWSALARSDASLVQGGSIASERSGLFSSTPVFLARSDLDAMSAVARTIDAISRLPAWAAAALARAPPVALTDPGPRGVFMGYDFHLTPQGPRLIEVNTNAGGAFLNALLGQAQAACCPEVAAISRPPPLARFEEAVWAMFLAEWRLQGREGAPAVIAIVDETPEGQYLYPEFLQTRAVLERRGARVVIADPSALSYSGGRLRLGELPIDLVYNRWVDFAFATPAAAALRQAWLQDAAVVTPNPHNHALLADKRNLTLLSDPARLEALGVDPSLRAALAGLPRTRLVTAEASEELWASRKGLFFKPAGGHAGKAVYRGDKLTHRVWAEILRGDYVAQDFAAPSQRRVKVDGDPQDRKLDVRLYAYAGEPLLVAARLYQGQTTNFRTPGGGFAPVVVLDGP